MQSLSPSSPGTSGAGKAARRSDARLLTLPSALLLLAPMALFLIAFFVLPLLWLVRTAFFGPDGFDLSVMHQVIVDPIVQKVAVRTFVIAVVVTLISVMVAIPVAMLMANASGLTSRLVMLAVIIPLWTSVLIRTYAWAVILRSNGLANTLIVGSGLSDQPLRLMYTDFAVILAMVHVLLPFAVLPIYTALHSIPADLKRAALIHGARELRAFIDITLPLARQGIVTGMILTFMLAAGFFVTPALVGGPRSLMVATLIRQQMYELGNWRAAAAISVLLVVFTLIIASIFRRYLRVETKAGAKA